MSIDAGLGAQASTPSPFLGCTLQSAQWLNSFLTQASQQRAAAIVQILGNATRVEGRKQGLAAGLWAGQLCLAPSLMQPRLLRTSCCCRYLRAFSTEFMRHITCLT